MPRGRSGFGGYGRPRRQSLPRASARPHEGQGHFTALSATASPTSSGGSSGSPNDETKLVVTATGQQVVTADGQSITTAL